MQLAPAGEPWPYGQPYGWPWPYPYHLSQQTKARVESVPVERPDNGIPAMRAEEV